MDLSQQNPSLHDSWPKAKPIIPWMGGKRRLAKRILPFFPAHTCYVEPFAGGAALFFTKIPSAVEVLNDIHGELVNLYRVVKYHLDELVRQFRWALISRDIFTWLKMTPTETLTDIQRAARFYYLQKTAFGAKVTGQNFGTSALCPARLNLTRMEEDLSAAHIRLSRTYIERLDWYECIRRYDRPDTLFYLDPPYYGTTGYCDVFPLNEYDRIAELARSIKGRMIVSVNDIPEMHKAFAGLYMHELQTHYTVGGPPKAKNNSRELLIRNFT